MFWYELNIFEKFYEYFILNISFHRMFNKMGHNLNGVWTNKKKQIWYNKSGSQAI